MNLFQVRSRKNAITLVGQSISFVVEVTYGILMQFLTHSRSNGILEPAALPCVLMIAIAIITWTQILTSPELRRNIGMKLASSHHIAA